MIRELAIEKFGRFAARRFPLSPVTFFIGRNESGKTTLLDIFFQELCHPGARGEGRKLKERYGEERSARLVCDGEPVAVDEKEFWNLWAIRSGDISLDLASGSTWMERVKSRLFTGGIDPGRLRDRFETLASTKGSLRHNRELKALESEVEELQRRLEGLYERRGRILEREKNAAGMQLELEEQAREARRQEEELERLEGELAFQKKAAERKELNDLLARMERGAERVRRLQELQGYPEREIAEYDRSAAEHQQLRRQLDLAEQQALALQGTLRDKERAAAGLEEQLARQRVAAQAAGEFLGRIDLQRRELARRGGMPWNRGLLAAAFAGLALGIALALLSSDLAGRIGLLAGAVLLWGVALLLARRLRPAGGGAGEGAAARSLREEWRARLAARLSAGEGSGMEAPVLRSETLGGLASELQALQVQADGTAGRLAELGAEAARLRREQIDREEGAGALRRRAEEAASRLEEWLRRRQVRTRDEYLSRSVELRTLAQEQARWEEDLRRELAHRGCPDAGQLKRDCERRLGDLDREGVPAAAAPEAELRRRDAELRARRARLQEARGELARGESRLAQEGGEITGSLGSIPEEIAGAERRLLEAQGRIRELQLDREAAALAREIFERIALDSETMLQELGRELAGQFGQIVPRAGEVEVPELDAGAFRVADGGGEMRPMEHLSQGTQDAFLLAARLALARKARFDGEAAGGAGNDPARSGVLVLDEPFHALDLDRIRRALQMIARFQAENGWQVILLSKDERLPELARGIFADLQVHLLDPD
jgi:hypothetical protein